MFLLLKYDRSIEVHTFAVLSSFEEEKSLSSVTFNPVEQSHFLKTDSSPACQEILPFCPVMGLYSPLSFKTGRQLTLF
jgi:hypothetical protein